MKKSCKNCKAFIDAYVESSCKLGFEIDCILLEGKIVEFFPLVICPKPLTFDKLFTYIQAIENKR